MNDIYTPPSAELNDNTPQSANHIKRPRAVTVIAWLFIALAALDFIYRIQSGFMTQSVKYDETGNIIGNSHQFQILWLIFYGIGAGLMRRGKFARGFACFIGTLALIIPGAIFIYYLYFSNAKDYFNLKECPNCFNQKWKNADILFRKQQCKTCGHEVSVKSN